jgi:hypothetical protein
MVIVNELGPPTVEFEFLWKSLETFALETFSGAVPVGLSLNYFVLDFVSVNRDSWGVASCEL